MKNIETSENLERDFVPLAQSEEEINAALLAELGIVDSAIAPPEPATPIRQRPLTLEEQIERTKAETDRLMAAAIQIKLPPERKGVLPEVVEEEKPSPESLRITSLAQVSDARDDAETLLRTKKRMVEIFKEDRSFFECAKTLLAEVGLADRFSEQEMFEAAAPFAAHPEENEEWYCTNLPGGSEPVGYVAGWAGWLARYTVRALKSKSESE